jgi:peptidoglycan/LPS O-acetylase OafA/YrhL
MKYRPEIDGLRAIAVLCVVLFHADIRMGGVPLLSGGFIGVDVFFLISGYLISRLVLTELREGRFSFAAFYERRVRRILPALLLVMLASLPFAWLIMMPSQLTSLAGSIGATLTFWSNIFFWQQDGYFAEANTFKPFLHTWSLSVEEQFYLLFPPFLLLLWRRAARQLGAVLIGCLLTSFLLSFWLAQTHPVAAFFLLPTRGWELLVGALLAYSELMHGRPAATGFKTLLPCVGLLLILLFAVFASETTPYVLQLTALPVLGAALIVWYSDKDFVSNLLASKPFVAIGLISYSLYLWHQPVFAFDRLILDAFDLPQKLCALALCFILAALSWRFVEQPFRNRSNISRKTLAVSVSVVTVILFVFVALVYWNHGYASRFPFAAKAANYQANEDLIFQTDEAKRDDILNGCAAIDRKNKNYWLLLGDSAARKLFQVKDALDQRHIPHLQSTELACPYLPGFTSYDNHVNGKPCEAINEERRACLKTLPPATIIYVARTQYYIEQHDFDINMPDGNGMPLKIAPVKATVNKDISSAVHDGFVETIEGLLTHGNRVILIYPTPEFAVYPPDEIVRQRAALKTEDAYQAWLAEGGVHISFTQFKKRTARSYAAYDAVANNPNLLRIYPEKLFCNQLVKGQCNGHDATRIYFNDSGHLSSEGAAMLIDLMLREAEKKWGRLSPN